MSLPVETSPTAQYKLNCSFLRRRTESRTVFYFRALDMSTRVTLNYCELEEHVWQDLYSGNRYALRACTCVYQRYLPHPEKENLPAQDEMQHTLPSRSLMQSTKPRITEAMCASLTSHICISSNGKVLFSWQCMDICWNLLTRLNINHYKSGESTNSSTSTMFFKRTDECVDGGFC